MLESAGRNTATQPLAASILGALCCKHTDCIVPHSYRLRGCCKHIEVVLLQAHWLHCAASKLAALCTRKQPYIPEPLPALLAGAGLASVSLTAGEGEGEGLGLGLGLASVSLAEGEGLVPVAAMAASGLGLGLGLASEALTTEE